MQKRQCVQGVFKFPAPTEKLSAGDYLRQVHEGRDPRALLVDTTSVKLAPGWQMQSAIKDASNWLTDEAERTAETVEKAYSMDHSHHLLLEAAERRAWVVRVRPKWIQAAAEQGDSLSFGRHVLFGLRDAAMAGRALQLRGSKEVLDEVLTHTRALDEAIGWNPIPMTQFAAMQSATVGFEVARRLGRQFRLEAPNSVARSLSLV